MTTNSATYPAPPQAVKTVPGNITIPPPRRNEAVPITHAWSIGTTRIVQPAPEPGRKEECPPEVFIG